MAPSIGAIGGSAVHRYRMCAVVIFALLPRTHALQEVSNSLLTIQGPLIRKLVEGQHAAPHGSKLLLA